MFINEDVELDESSLPKMMQEDIKILRDYYAKGEWGLFDNYFEAAEACAKQFWNDGRISWATLEAYRNKYGIC